MKRIAIMAMVMLMAGMVCNGYTATAEEEILRAVVRIRSVIPAHVPSAETLGTKRVGNGVIIDSEGTVLTLAFLTREAESIEVTGLNNEPVEATVIGYDYNTGFSLLRTKKPLGIPPIKLGRSAALAVGDPAIVAGADGVKELQISQVVSRREFAGSWEYLLEDALFTAPAFADFSGASLINTKGELIGIGYLFTQTLLRDHGLIPCNLFIPIDALKPILADLKSAGRSLNAKRPWMGINAEEAHGRVFITKVTAGGPAEKGGLQAEDMVVSVDGKTVRGLADFYRKIWGVGDAGVLLPLTVLKGDKLQEMKIPSADRYREAKAK